MAEVKNGKPVKINMVTTHNQDGEISRHEFEEMGQIVYLNKAYYIRYNETAASDQTSVTIKIDEDQNVTLIRRGQHTTRLKFQLGETSLTRYETPYGVMPLEVSTQAMQLLAKNNPFQGSLNIDYTIQSQGNLLGIYKIELRFTT